MKYLKNHEISITYEVYEVFQQLGVDTASMLGEPVQTMTEAKKIGKRQGNGFPWYIIRKEVVLLSPAMEKLLERRNGNERET